MYTKYTSTSIRGRWLFSNFRTGEDFAAQGTDDLEAQIVAVLPATIVIAGNCPFVAQMASEVLFDLQVNTGLKHVAPARAAAR